MDTFVKKFHVMSTLIGVISIFIAAVIGFLYFFDQISGRT